MALVSDFQQYGCVELPKQMVPDVKGWAVEGSATSFTSGYLHTHGWAFAATSAIEAQLFNRTGTFVLSLNYSSVGHLKMILATLISKKYFDV